VEQSVFAIRQKDSSFAQIDPSSTNTRTFRNQAYGHNNSYLSRSDMLQKRYDFDATIQAFGTRTNTASARTMLSADHFDYWLRGTRATSIILADHSTNRLYDFGHDDYRSVRPVFHATFWPLISNVHVRIIGENSSTEFLQDQFYALDLTIAHTSPATVYIHTGLTHSQKLCPRKNSLLHHLDLAGRCFLFNTSPLVLSSAGHFEDLMLNPLPFRI
jgi:hypothetical protein